MDVYVERDLPGKANHRLSGRSGIAKARKVFPAASMGVTHALRGLPRMATQGLGGAWIAQPNETHASNG